MTGIKAFEAEQQRQREVEGWTEAHDDEHTDESMALAGAAYALPLSKGQLRRAIWPWDRKWFKPVVTMRFRPGVHSSARGDSECTGFEGIRAATEAEKAEDRQREIVKAGALLASEYDRLERFRAAQEPTDAP